MSSAIVFQPNLRTKSMPGASKLLFVISLAALFCNFCKWFFQLDHSSPTRNSNDKNEVLQIPAYSLFKVSKGRIDLACFKNQLI